jgi:hypothetical protein
MRSALARCSASRRQKSAVSFVFFFAIVSEDFEDLVELHVHVLAGGEDSFEHLAIRELGHTRNLAAPRSRRKMADWDVAFLRGH